MTSWKEACVVEMASVASIDKQASTSGILLRGSPGYVLTHGSILAPFISHKKQDVQKIVQDNYINIDQIKAKLGVRVSLEPSEMQTLKGKGKSVMGQPSRYNASLLNVTVSQTAKVDRPLSVCQASIQHIWKVRNFARTLEKLMPPSDGWRFIEMPNENKNEVHSVEPRNKIKSKENEAIVCENDVILTLMPYFVLLKLCDWKTDGPPSHSNVVSQSHLCIGDSVYAVGTPFGNLSPQVFMNSVSQGVISNLAGERQELILTDARCIPGSEGGALYVGQTLNRAKLVGVVVASLCWKANEWVGLSVACALTEVLSSLVISMPSKLHTLGLDLAGLDTTLSRRWSANGIVLVRCEGSWGTGIIIHPTLVLTCGHVVKFSSNMQVEVQLGGTRRIWQTADVVYCGQKDQLFDVAVLQLQRSTLTEEQIVLPQVTIPEEGAEVVIIGHGVFGAEHNLEPSVCKGVISRVLSVQHVPVLVQSTCAVHAGMSGGPMVDKQGRLVGMATCNAKDVVSGSSYPHVNLSIPMATIWPILKNYIKTRDHKLLSSLQIKNPFVVAAWSLKPSDHKYERKSKL